MSEKGPNLQKAIAALMDFKTPNLALPEPEWGTVLAELKDYQESFNPPGDIYVYPQKLSNGRIKLTPKAKPHWWDGRKFFLLKGKPVYLENVDGQRAI